MTDLTDGQNMNIYDMNMNIYDMNIYLMQKLHEDKQNICIL